MAFAARLNLRMQKEIKLLLDDPPHGVSLNLSEDENVLSSLSSIEASMSFIFYYFLFTFNRLSIFTVTLYADPYSLNQGIEGPEGTVYANGVFILKIQIPERCIFYRYQNQTSMPH